MRVLGIVGSLRARSFNRTLLRHAAGTLPVGTAWREWEGLAELPAFNEDEERDPGDRVTALREAIADADALLVVTPEYNGSVPGALKNAMDWASRPEGAGVLAGKPVAVIGASPSRFGAAWSQAELRKVLSRSGARVVEAQLCVCGAHEAFTADGTLADPDHETRLAAILDDLVAFADRADARVC